MKIKVLKKRKPLKRVNKNKYRFWNELMSTHLKQSKESAVREQAR
ncbi:hypothetical protein [uncultured Cocleimonas sp.]|nr:hypothetical protein [uncultured Cocleimonas sp.]